MEHLDSYAIVLTPHIQDLQLFEEIISQIVHLLQRSNYYSIIVEHEETNRHIDAVIFLPKNKRFNNFINPLYELLHKKFDNTNTVFEILIGGTRKSKLIKPSDTYYRLGYNLKEIEDLKTHKGGGALKKRFWTNIDNQILLEAKEFYVQEKTFRKQTENQIINLNKTNIIFHLLKYYKENKENIKELEEIQTQMITDGYSFVGLPRPSLRRAFLEFLIHIDGQSSNHLEELNTDMKSSEGSLYSYKRDYFELKHYINSLPLNETILKIQTHCNLKLSTW